MKKRLAAILCAAALCLGLLTLPASADDGLFFLSLNDTLPAQSAQITPIQSGGWIYVPASVFNNRVSGVNFGIYYGFTDNNAALTFYNLSGRTLTFDLNNNTASTSTGDAVMPGRVVWQNGICYVPAYALCHYYGLTYSYYTTDYGPLLRIKDGNAYLSDSMLISSDMSLMRSRYNAYQASLNTTTPSTSTAAQPTTPSTTTTPATRPSTGATTTPATTTQPAQDQPEPVKTFSLYVGLQSDGDITAALDALAAVNATAIVFFPTDSLAENADQIRQAAGRGHRVGLIPQGDTPAQRLASANEGSGVLARILRQETWFVLVSDKELADAGYLCWSPTVTVPSSDAYAAIAQSGVARSGASRVLASSNQSLSSLWTQLNLDGDTFLAPRETQY